MSDEPSWIVLMTERYPRGDGPARVFALKIESSGLRRRTGSLKRAGRFTRDGAESEAAAGYPGYVLTAVPTGPGVPGLAWEETR